MPNVILSRKICEDSDGKIFDFSNIDDEKKIDFINRNDKISLFSK